MNKKIFISTGEVSGDLHGSLLSKALLDEAKKKSIDLEICGLGGERMKEEGVKILKDTTSISAIGIWQLWKCSCSRRKNSRTRSFSFCFMRWREIYITSNRPRSQTTLRER